MTIRQLIERDGNNCHYCRCEFGVAWLAPSRDHIIPVSKGGTNAAANMVLACKRCNSLKGSCDYAIFIQQLPSILAQLDQLSKPKVRQTPRVKIKRIKKPPFTIEFSPERAFQLALEHYKRFGRKGLGRQWIDIFEEMGV